MGYISRINNKLNDINMHCSAIEDIIQSTKTLTKRLEEYDKVMHKLVEQRNEILELKKELNLCKWLVIKQAAPKHTDGPDIYEVNCEKAELTRRVNGTKETYILTNIEIDFEGIKDGSNPMK